MVPNYNSTVGLDNVLYNFIMFIDKVKNNKMSEVPHVLNKLVFHPYVNFRRVHDRYVRPTATTKFSLFRTL